MSRIGKKPVIIPDGVEVKIDGQVVTAKGPLGTETVELRDEVIVSIKDENDRTSKSLWGLSRTLVNNAVVGVKEGFTKKLEIQGVGYRANMEGNNLNLVLGFSHPVLVTPPEGVKIAVEANTKITVTGSNKQAVGDVAAEIRGKRPPEVYKGKGVRYEGEYVRRKAGKTGKK